MAKYTYVNLLASCRVLFGFFNSNSWKTMFAIEKSEGAFGAIMYNLICGEDHFNLTKWPLRKNYDINDVISVTRELSSLWLDQSGLLPD